MRFRVQITRRPGIADPEGATTARALRELGYAEVESVRFGRDMTVEVSGDDEEIALKRVTDMCERLLANPVIENYTVERVE